MVNPANRELSTRLYRWMERFERPVQSDDPERNVAYFTDAWNELDGIMKECSTPWAMMLCIGYYQALEAVYKEASK